MGAPSRHVRSHTLDRNVLVFKKRERERENKPRYKTTTGFVVPNLQKVELYVQISPVNISHTSLDRVWRAVIFN